MEKNVFEGNQTDSTKKIMIFASKKYRDFRFRNLILRGICLAILLLLVAILGLSFSFGSYENHLQEVKKYEERIGKLQEEREDVLSGKIKVKSGDFEEVLAKNMSQLKDFPQEEDNYQVKISDSNSVIAINRNNIFVSDNAHILSDAVKKKIYQLNKQLAAGTDGAQLEVVTVNQLPSNESIESYANKIFRQLGIGNAEKNNGVLYLIALDDREFRLEVGYGLEGLLPDSRASDIINDDDVVENFKDENYSAGVNQVVDEVFDVMNSKTALVDSKIALVKDDLSRERLGFWGLLILCLVFILIGLILFGMFRRASKKLKQMYQEFQMQMKELSARPADLDSQELASAYRLNPFYLLASSHAFLIFSSSQIKYIVQRQKLFVLHPEAKSQGFGRVLDGDTLYSWNGDVLTTSYLASQYNSANRSSSSGGGDSSWGGFGGGSSGGGGASGGW